MISLLLAFAGMAIILLVLNRKELLVIIKDKEAIVDANTRAITDLESRNHLLILTLQEHQLKLDNLTEQFEKEKDRSDKVVSQRISSQVKMGAISENALPLLKDIPYDCTNLRHLGMPIDFIYFDYKDPGELVFVEVKSGAAKESKRQKLIKNMIKDGKVHYDLVQINEEGVKVTRKV